MNSTPIIKLLTTIITKQNVYYNKYLNFFNKSYILIVLSKPLLISRLNALNIAICLLLIG